MERKFFVLQLFDTFTSFFVHCERMHGSFMHNMDNAAMLTSDLLCSNVKSLFTLNVKIEVKQSVKKSLLTGGMVSRPILPVRVTVTINSDLFFYKIRSVVWPHFF